MKTDLALPKGTGCGEGYTRDTPGVWDEHIHTTVYKRLSTRAYWTAQGILLKTAVTYMGEESEKKKKTVSV